MQGGAPYLRTIEESELVVKRIDEAVQKEPNLHDLYEYGIKWKLARNPESGAKVPNSEYHIAKTFSWRPGGVPSITVLYKFDEEKVSIESSRIDWPKP